MRIDRVKLIAEMARQEISVKDLAEKSGVSRVTVTRKSCSANSVHHVACALGIQVEELMEVKENG